MHPDHIDSNLASLEEALVGTTAPDEVLQTLALVTVRYLSFDGFIHQGQIVVEQRLAEDVVWIFDGLRAIGFPVAKAVPISQYGWSDDRSMADNNASAFNYRLIIGKNRLSNHSFGFALDVNPALNPYYAIDGNVYPPEAVYNPQVPGTFVKGGEAVALFRKRGWEWGGDWEETPDFQHFQKLL